jgi:hypothetical protein
VVGKLSENQYRYDYVEGFSLLGYNVVYSGESQPQFLRIKLPPSSGLKSKRSKQPTRSRFSSDYEELYP